jgi:methylenetetrahydrofolate dehydrogenase (NADP+)/methenyltetrahydrofolate cyclohydrolase
VAELLKGSDVANALVEKISRGVSGLNAAGIVPGLAIVRAGARPEDLSYERSVQKKCEKLGVACKVFTFEETVSNEVFMAELRQINGNAAIHGILVFRPLPGQISEATLKGILDPSKDIDCLTPVNIAKVFEGDESGYAPCTARSVMEILDHYRIALEGKRVAIAGRSMVVGRPLAMMMLKRNATVTLCHSRTRDLKQECRRADIVVAAIGKARFITRDYVSPGAVVIDVGINLDTEGRLCGDVDFEGVCGLASAITPVPGGVGTVTSTVLIGNAVQAAGYGSHEGAN